MTGAIRHDDSPAAGGSSNRCHSRGAEKALGLEEHVRRVVAEVAPLTDEQRDRIADLLRFCGGATP